MNPAKILPCFVLFAIASSGLFAQTSEDKYYERALEDSLTRYELLKPAYVQLQTNFQDVQIQNVSLFTGLQEEKLQHKATETQLSAAVEGQRKKWRNGFAWGWAVGTITTAIIVLK